MITTVTLNPSIDREYFVDSNQVMKNQYIYTDEDVRVYPGGKGLIAAINLKNLGYTDVQNIGFVGGKQGLYFEKMVQNLDLTTNYINTDNEIRNNVKIIGKDPFTYTQYNDYTYSVDDYDVNQLIKRFKRGITSSKLIMIAGSIPEGVDFSIYKKLTNICHEMGKEVYLQASGEALNLALETEPRFVVPYFKHHKTILDKEIKTQSEFIEAGKRLQEHGARNVIIPFHCDRLLFAENGSVYKLTPEDYCIRNWLGASDAYNAGFFDYIERYGCDFLEANRQGAAAALSISESKSVFLESRKEITLNMSRIIIQELEV